MLSIIISIVAGFCAGAGMEVVLDSPGWGITVGCVVTIGVMFAMTRYFGKRLTNIANQVQNLIQESQNEAQRLINRFQTKPGSSQKVMQTQIEKIVEKGILKALDVLTGARPLYKWSPLAERQINTLKMQLHYQIKGFEEVDRLVSKIIVLDPMTLAMKMARQYHQKSADLDKTFRRGVKKFKYEKATLIYSLYAWMLVKRKETEKALEVLAVAKEKTEHETIQRNWQHLANNKPNLFSNAGLGEQWYALHLEAPPKQKVGKGRMKSNPMMPKGKRRFM